MDLSAGPANIPCMTPQTENTRPHPVAAASRLLAALRRYGLAAVVDQKIATDIEDVARFTIGQYTCSCDVDEQTHIVGHACPPHPLTQSR